MADKKRLIFPFGGLSDNESFGDQQEGTSRDAVNVRGFDASTGRMRGGQRSGLSKFASAQLANSPVRDVNSVSFHVPRVTYTALTSSQTVEWSVDTPRKEAVKGIEVDWRGNLYVLDGTHRIIQYNPDGERTASITIAGNDGFRAVGAPAVDMAGNIYVGMENSVGNGSGKILRFAPDADPDDYEVRRWDSIYEFDLDYAVVKLRHDLGILYALTQDTNEKKAKLVAIGFPDSTVPMELWSKSIPYPANDFDFHEGNIFVAIGSDTDREGSIAGGQGTKTINWVPHELGNYAENTGSASDSKHRLHAWLDARYIGDASDAGELLLWPDRRFAVTEPGTSYWDSPTDTYERNAFAIESDDNTYWSPPIFSGNAFGGSPCVQFEGAHALRTQPNLTATVRAAAASGWPGNDQGAIIPGYGTGVRADDEKGTAFGFSTLFRVRDTSAMRVVYSQHGNGVCFAVIANAEYRAVEDGPNTIAHAPNKVAVYYGGMHKNGDGPFQDKQAVASGEIGTDGVCNLSVVFNREVTGNSTYHYWTVRINGVQVNESTAVLVNADTTFPNLVRGTDIWGPESHTVIGAATMFQDHALADTSWPSYVEEPSDANPTGSHYGMVIDPAELHPFIGDIVEVISYLPKIATSNTWDGWGITNALMAREGAYGGERPYLVVDSSGSNVFTPGYCTHETTATYATDIEKIEGYLMHKQGLQSRLGQFAAADDVPGNQVNGVPYPLLVDHLFVSSAPATDGGGGSGVWDVDIDSNLQELSKRGPILMKLAPAGGALVWAKSLSGVGFSVRANSDGDLLCTGEAWADSTTTGSAGEGTDIAWDYGAMTESATQPATARKVVDGGTTATSSGGESWVYSPVSGQADWNTSYATPQVAIDTADNFYVVLNDNSGTIDIIVFRSAKSGTNADDVYWSLALTSSVSADLDATQKLYAIALPPTIPDWPETQDEKNRVPEFLYLGTDRGDNEDKALHKMRIVTAAVPTSGDYSPRQTVYTAVCDGKLWRYKKGDPDGDVPKNPTGSSSAIFRSTTPYVMSAVLQEKMYLVDGENVYVYNPKPLLGGWQASPQHDSVELLKAKSAGEVPKRPKLIASWRGRLVMARTADSAHDWYMSKIGEPDNWDYFPPFVTPDQAVSGGVSSVGLSPDIINTIIPYNDDLLIFGCDQSIVRLTGDPMMGGQLDLISDSIGMAFGQSWAKDPEGAIYFLGSGGLGGVYRMAPSGEMQRISLGRIDKRLMDLDLEKYKARLVWNDRDEGLHVFMAPYKEADAGDVAHYFWERRNMAWFEDRFSNSLHHPFSVATVDGDAANDRQLLLGCEDGYVRFWDNAAKDDDGSKIDSRVLMGPLIAGEPGLSGRWSRLEATLGDALDGARVELLASESPEVLGDVVAQGDLVAGQNEILPLRARGAAVWVRLRNNLAGQSWALESLQMLMQIVSRRKVRS